MHNMHKKICLRLSSALHRDLQQTARRRHVTSSALVRAALQQVLEQSTPASVPSALPPNDSLEWLVMTLPPEVQQPIRQAVTATDLPLESVLKALIITACELKATPQSSTNTEALPMTTPPA
jgi:hypothetical protein